MTWICNYIYIKPWDVLLITNTHPSGVILCTLSVNEGRRYIALPGHIHKMILVPCPIFNGGLTKPPLKLRHGYFPRQALDVVYHALISNTVNHFSKGSIGLFLVAMQGSFIASDQSLKKIIFINLWQNLMLHSASLHHEIFQPPFVTLHILWYQDKESILTTCVSTDGNRATIGLIFPLIAIE